MKRTADNYSDVRSQHQEDAQFPKQHEQPKRVRKHLKAERSLWRSEMQEDFGNLSAHHMALLERSCLRQSQRF